MSDALYRLAEAMITKTDEKKLRWERGASPSAFHALVGDHTVSIWKDNVLYALELRGADGAVLDRLTERHAGETKPLQLAQLHSRARASANNVEQVVDVLIGMLQKAG